MLQRLLRHFLGVFAVAAHEPTVVEDLGAEMFHKAVERLWFSSHQLPREFYFGFTFQGSGTASDCSGPHLELRPVRAPEHGPRFRYPALPRACCESSRILRRGNPDSYLGYHSRTRTSIPLPAKALANTVKAQAPHTRR